MKVSKRGNSLAVRLPAAAVEALGLSIAERCGLSVFDSTVAASAVLAGCTALLTEDMQDGQALEGGLRSDHPFP